MSRSHRPLALLATALPLLTLDAGPTLTGLPVQARNDADLASLKGPNNLVQGEIVVWIYPFPWAGTTAEGGKVPLTKGQRFFFSEMSNSALRLFYGEAIATVRFPPHIRGIHNLVTLAPLDVSDLPNKIAATVVANRIGRPSATSSRGGTTVLRYAAKPVELTRTRFDSVSSTSDSTFYDQKGNAFTGQTNTTTMVPRRETRIYIPYDFEVLVNKNGIVTAVNDLLSTAR